MSNETMRHLVHEVMVGSDPFSLSRVTYGLTNRPGSTVRPSVPRDRRSLGGFLTLSSRLLLVFIVLCFLTGQAFSQKKVVAHADQIITPEFLQRKITWLAADEMKGRYTADSSFNAIADQIALQFQASGLSPINGSYLQPLDYCTRDLGPNLFLALIAHPETISFRIGDDFIPYDFSGSKPAEGEVVFAGYGITAPEHQYDDYRDLDVRGKIVLILRMEPGQNDTNQISFSGSQILTNHSGLKEKYRNAQEHGAAGVLVVSGPMNFSDRRPTGSPWPLLNPDKLQQGSPVVICGNSEKSIPIVQVGDSVIISLFGSVDSLRRVQQRIDDQIRPQSYRLAGQTLAMNIDLTFEPIRASNVIGFLQGSDDRHKDEVVVVGAHYDHVGTKSAEKGPDEDTIFNGADDNASGVGALLAIARTFGTMPEKPGRSILFVAFAGEEVGLLGSHTYVRRPLFPLEKTIAMLNLDMIGRNDPDSLFVLGARQNPDLAGIIRKANRNTGFKLRFSNGKKLPGGSDHVPFFQSGISSVFLFAGLHKDYHQVTDEAGLIDYSKSARVAKLAFLTAWRIANSKGKLRIVVPEREEK